jgi:hypothetical protein
MNKLVYIASLINKLYKVESSDYRALGILEDRWENSLAF